MLSTTGATIHYAATSMRVDSEAAGIAFLTTVAFIVSIELLGHNFFFFALKCRHWVQPPFCNHGDATPMPATLHPAPQSKVAFIVSIGGLATFSLLCQTERSAQLHPAIGRSTQ